MSHDVVVEQDPVAAEDVACVGGDVAGSSGVVAFGEGGDGVGEAAGVGELGESEAVQLHRSHLTEHRDELLLDELTAYQGLSELVALLGVAQGTFVGGDGVAQ